MPIYALNQVSDERCDWLVPGMLRDKVHALLKSLPQRPRSRLVPLPDTTAEFCELAPFAQGELLDVLLKFVRERTQLAVQRNDFKLDAVPAHLFMNLRVVDEHGRQLAMGRHLASLKAQWGAQARTAFQALAALKLERGARGLGCAAWRLSEPAACRTLAAWRRARSPRPIRRATRHGPSASCRS